MSDAIPKRLADRLAEVGDELEARVRLRRALGIVIARRRYALALKQDDLAVRADSDRSVVARIETGKHELTLGTLHRFAQALDLRPSELLGEAERLADRAAFISDLRKDPP